MNVHERGICFSPDTGGGGSGSAVNQKSADIDERLAGIKVAANKLAVDFYTTEEGILTTLVGDPLMPQDDLVAQPTLVERMAARQAIGLHGFDKKAIEERVSRIVRSAQWDYHHRP